VSAGTGDLPFGVVRLMAGLAFSLGLILIIVGGAELFTGNTLIVMAWASRKMSSAVLAQEPGRRLRRQLRGRPRNGGLMFASGQ
jgi:formate transporter